MFRRSDLLFILIAIFQTSLLCTRTHSEAINKDSSGYAVIWVASPVFCQCLARDMSANLVPLMYQFYSDVNQRGLIPFSAALA